VTATWFVLGAGSILPRVGYGCAGYALRPAAQAGVALFDCGPGTLRMLAQCGLELAQVHTVVISHFHADHMLDLFALAFARRNPALEHAPALTLVGPQGIVERLERGADAIGSSTRLSPGRVLEVEHGRPTDALELDGFVLRGAPSEHTSSSFAWRADANDWSVTYSGDAVECESLVRLAHGSQLFVCESSFHEEQRTENHMTPGGAGRVARAAGVRELLLTHFYPATDPERAIVEARAEFGGPIRAARDGLSVPLGRAR